MQSVASNEQGNILISPVSVKAALAMVLEGAGGKSAKELREALRLTEDVKETRTMFKNFLNLLQVCHFIICIFSQCMGPVLLQHDEEFE